MTRFKISILTLILAIGGAANAASDESMAS
jgi:hypothetical protein